MMRLLSSSVFVALFLLPPAATAYAECAWAFYIGGELKVGPKAPACANVLLLTSNRAVLC